MFRDLTFDEFCLRLEDVAKCGRLALLTHTHPDGDCIGSAAAMAALLGQLGCDCRIVCADSIPGRLEFLLPRSQTDITPESLPEAFRPGACPAVALDVASPGQLGRLDGLYDIKLTADHHVSSAPISDRFLDGEASAAGEIVWRVAVDLKKRGLISRIPRRTAMCCYAAISSDTGCFRYSNVTPETHRIAARLVKRVKDHADVDRLLFDTKTPGRLAAEAAAAGSLRIFSGGDITVSAFSLEDMERKNIPTDETEAFIEVARTLAGTKIALSVREDPTEPGKYRVSARSNSDADVSAVCRAFGGGGHVKAAGCSVFATDLNSAVLAVVAEAEKQLG